MNLKFGGGFFLIPREHAHTQIEVLKGMDFQAFCGWTWLACTQPWAQPFFFLPTVWMFLYVLQAYVDCWPVHLAYLRQLCQFHQG